MVMDFITSLSKSQSYGVVLVMVDHFAKSTHIKSIVDIITVLGTVYHFLKRWGRNHRLQRVIVLNRDLKFTNAFWRHVLGRLVQN